MGGLDGNRPRSRQGDVPPAAPPYRVRLPVNIHGWHDISFVHWPLDPAALQPLVPDEVTVLTYGGAAWVGVTPFTMRVRVPGLPAVPGLSVFPETNVRTYVRGPRGREGLWFLRMEVTRTWFVATLRALGLPYVRQRMSVDKEAERISYRSRAPSSGVLSHHVAVRPDRPLRPFAGGPQERFLTARWGAFHRRGPWLMYTRADHPPWPLYAAEIDTCEVAGLLGQAGLPALDGPPLVHFSPGVPVRISRPQIVAGPGA